MPIFGLFQHFNPGSYRGFFRKNGQKWPFSPKLAKNGVFGHNTPFWGILGLFGPSGARCRRGFTSTPRAGAPPRGVDVKPLAGGGSQGPGRPFRTLRGPGTGSRGPGSRRPPGSGSRGAPLPRGRSRRALRTPSGVPDAAAGVVLHQPLAAGPRGFRRGSRGSGVPEGSRETSREAFSQPWPRRASDPFSPRPGNRGRSHPREAREPQRGGAPSPKRGKRRGWTAEPLPASSCKGDEQNTWGNHAT